MRPWLCGRTAGLVLLSRRPGVTLPGVQAQDLAPADPTLRAVIMAEVLLFWVNLTLASPKFKKLKKFTPGCISEGSSDCIFNLRERLC